MNPNFDTLRILFVAFDRASNRERNATLRKHNAQSELNYFLRPEGIVNEEDLTRAIRAFNRRNRNMDTESMAHQDAQAARNQINQII